MTQLGRRLHLIAFIAGAFAALVPATLAAQTPATLAGVVRDSAGKPVADAEVTLRNATRATRTDDRGQFTLDGVNPGSYTVSFRRLGYHSVEYTWSARNGQRTEVSVVFTAIARQLDPVVVRAEEDKRAASHASILGLVIDPQDQAIPEAEVQLVGANIGGTTRANGGFLFKPLAVGSYVVRVRKLGYAPAMVTVQLVQDDDHEVVVRMEPLATNLDPVVVNERSGYGDDQSIFDELDRRTRWKNSRTRLYGPEDLKSFYGKRLDEAVIQMGLYTPPTVQTAKQARPTSIRAGGRGTRVITTAPNNGAGMGDTRRGDACILLNGSKGVFQPLTSFSTDDVDMLEVYPPGTEVTGTVSAHFTQNACRSLSAVDHPPYYVLWLK